MADETDTVCMARRGPAYVGVSMYGCENPIFKHPCHHSTILYYIKTLGLLCVLLPLHLPASKLPPPLLLLCVGM